VCIPDHFLHVWLGGPVAIGDRARTWAGRGSFDIDFRGVTCFHSAVVVEAHAPQLFRLVEGTGIDAGTFLPHMTIAVTREEHEAEQLREILAPLRRTALGSSTADEVKLVRFRAARSTLLAPWEAVEVMRF
jgi:2'-5' RNA ligase